MTDREKRPGLTVWLSAGALLLALAGALANLTWQMSSRPDRVEVREMIFRESPYLQDRGRIMAVVEDYQSMKDTLQQLKTDIAVIRSEMGAITVKLDQVLDTKRRR